MKTLNDFLNKLRSVEYNKAVIDRSIEGVFRLMNVKVTISTELPNNYIDIENMPVQVVMKVYINGKHAQSWGSESNADNVAMVKWFKVQEALASKAELASERQMEKEGKELFNSL